MKRGKTLFLSFVLSLAVWGSFSWPLPRHFSSAIPLSAQSFGTNIRAMAPGDQIQLLYHFWLFSDMVKGRTPFFSNIYEFNTGDDAARWRMDPFFFPFSMVFTVGRLIGSTAFAWNLTGLISLWLTFFFSWRLARRYISREWIAAGAALIAIAFPYRWATLLGGSPTGLAMMWVPMLMLGLDVAVREGRAAGGWLAGCAILFACWTDAQVFAFILLVTPIWCGIAFTQKADFAWRAPLSYTKLFTALLPTALMGVLAVLSGLAVKTGVPASGAASGVRSWAEVRLASPEWHGLFSLRATGHSSHIYLGYSMAAVVLSGWLILLWQVLADRQRLRNEWRSVLLFILLNAVIGIILCLAMGTHGPFDGAFIRTLRNIIPKFAMMRQTSKVFCLLPPFVVLAAALACSRLQDISRRRWPAGVAVALLVLVVGETRLRTDACLTSLETRQGAYAAVAAAAAAEGKAPHALVVPLWPGDSHYGSIYEYYASLYRIRMINGYSPFVPKDYVHDAFLPFESANQGYLSGEQLDALMKCGIGYIILHEDLFPEKVSPFPVVFTLKELLNHPRLQCLAQDGPVWAFKILKDPQARPLRSGDWLTFFPARRWELENAVSGSNTLVVQQRDAGGGAYATLSGPGAFVLTPSNRVTSIPDLRWMIRAKGKGTVGCVPILDGIPSTVQQMTIDAGDWKWIEVRVPAFDGLKPAALKIEWQEGAISLDLALLAAGPWRSLRIGESLELGAPLFFHAGCTDMERNAVRLRKGHDAQGIVFYGPKMPMEKGVYDVELRFASPEPPGVDLGLLNVEYKDSTGEGTAVPVCTGQSARGRLNQAQNLPFKVVFLYFGTGDMEIQGISFTRRE